MMSLSSTVNEIDSPCVPSRSVVTKVKIFIEFTVGVKGSSYWYAGFLLLFEERHHFPQRRTDDFDLVVVAGFTHREEFLAAAGFVFGDPGAGEFAGLDFGEDLLHLGSRLFIDDARTAGVIAIFG